jgi:hypothetical protein
VLIGIIEIKPVNAESEKCNKFNERKARKRALGFL